MKTNIFQTITGPTNEDYSKCAQHLMIYTRSLHVHPRNNRVQYPEVPRHLAEVLFQIYTASQMKYAVEEQAFYALAGACQEWGVECAPIVLPDDQRRRPGYEYPNPVKDKYPDAKAEINGALYDIEITRISPTDPSGKNIAWYSSKVNEAEAPSLSPVLYCFHNPDTGEEPTCQGSQPISEWQATSIPFHNPNHPSFVVLPPKSAASIRPWLQEQPVRFDDAPVVLLPNFDIDKKGFREQVRNAVANKETTVAKNSTGNKTMLVILAQSFPPQETWHENIISPNINHLDAVVLVHMSGYVGMCHDGKHAKVLKTYLLKHDWEATDSTDYGPIVTVLLEFQGEEFVPTEHTTVQEAMGFALHSRFY